MDPTAGVRRFSDQLSRHLVRAQNMWQTDWAEKLASAPGAPLPPDLAPEDVTAVYTLSWSEHCIECAVPDCYALCPLYVARRDRKCSRFKQGIVPNRKYPGLFDYGAEIEFRRWGKIESQFGFGAINPPQVRRLDRVDRACLAGTRRLSSWFRNLSPNYRMSGAYAVSREWFLKAMTSSRREIFDEFVVEIWNLKPETVRLVVECWQNSPKFRTSLELQPGRTVAQIPLASMGIDLYGESGFIRAYPENDAEAHLVFSWFDFVKYSTARQKLDPVAASTQSSTSKVKCVIWDLDRTVWEGILGEQDPDRIELRPAVLDTMRALDEKGIVQSIASKNDHDAACSVLQRLGIDHFFLDPQINWEPKSVSIRRIVASLNIGIDSCVFVDDSPFERAEVVQELPEIRALTEIDIPSMLSRPEFDVPVTDESRQRRTFYVAEAARKRQSIDYGDHYEAFLRTCAMTATLFRPAQPEHLERCLELLHRSNQLNLSTHRYTREEFLDLLQRADTLSIATSAKDRFGEYGLVGFASATITGETLTLKDFVLSCRVAQKKLENAWFAWLANLSRAAGYGKICATYIKTSRNGVLLKAFQDCGFVTVAEIDGGLLLELDCSRIPILSDIVAVEANGLTLIPGGVQGSGSESVKSSQIAS